MGNLGLFTGEVLKGGGGLESVSYKTNKAMVTFHVRKTSEDGDRRPNTNLMRPLACSFGEWLKDELNECKATNES